MFLSVLYVCIINNCLLFQNFTLIQSFPFSKFQFASLAGMVQTSFSPASIEPSACPEMSTKLGADVRIVARKMMAGNTIEIQRFTVIYKNANIDKIFKIGDTVIIDSLVITNEIAPVFNQTIRHLIESDLDTLNKRCSNFIHHQTRPENLMKVIGMYMLQYYWIERFVRHALHST